MSKAACFGRVLAAGLSLSVLWVAPGHAEGEMVDTVVARVNDTDITLGHMVALRESLPEQYQSLADDVLFTGILEQLIQQTALAQSRDGTLTPRDEVMLENERRAYLSGSVLQGVVEGAVTDATIQAAYDAKYAAATPATEYHAAHILVADEAVATDLKAQIDAGADFAELAKTHSTDGSAAGGGDLGWFGLGMMVKPFEDAVVALKPTEVAGPIQTQFGWHLIRLIETRDAAAPSLDEVRPDLAAEIERKAIEDRVAAATKDATITRVDGIDPALLRDQTLWGN